MGTLSIWKILVFLSTDRLKNISLPEKPTLKKVGFFCFQQHKTALSLVITLIKDDNLMC